jgi:uncharacterized membrane protein
MRPRLEPVGAKAKVQGQRDVCPGRAAGLNRHGLGWVFVLSLLPFALAYCLFVGSLAVARQQNLETNAFDLGYVSQALWEDAHGRLFRFTTVQDSNAVVEGVDLSRILHPHWLLAFHVEPALLLLAPVYRLWPDPRLLLWLQAAVIAAGALPAALLARRLIGGLFGPMAFGLAYLLTPGLEGAALSDFHMVAIGAALLMTALWLLDSGHTRRALACFGLTALCREDAALAVAAVGAVWWTSRVLPCPEGPGTTRNAARGKLRGRARFFGSLKVTSCAPLVLAGCAAAWAAASFLLIEPFFSGGISAFAGRYGWLVHDPLAVPGWLISPDVRDYLAVQLLAGGLVALLAPLQLAAALPLVAINALSSFDWMRSGGGHYSALLAPLLLWAGMHGVRRLKTLAGNTGAVLGSGIALAAALTAQAWIGVSPLRPGFTWPQADARAARVLPDLAAIPPGAPVSATSALYPHLSARSEAYWFPSTGGANWLALDIAGNTHPLSPAGARAEALRWLARPDVELVTADDGLLVLHRQSSGARAGLLAADPAERTLGEVARHEPDVLPAGFYGFATAGGRATAIGPIRFGPLALTGYELQRIPEVGLMGGSANLTTYWQAAEAMHQDLRFALATTRQPDGALVGYQEDAAAAPLWLPTSRWQAGQTIRLDMAVGQLHGVQALGIAVETRDGTRITPSGAETVWEGGTIAQIVRAG